jgi:outer membrane protein assembly factor BamA
MRFYLLTVFIFLSIHAIAQDDFTIVRKILIEGNRRTRASIITREMSVHEGDTLQNTAIEKILKIDQQNITNTNLFITVEVKLGNQSGNQADVSVVLKERLYFVALPVFFLADRNFNEWWYDRNRDLKRTIYGLYGRHFNLTGNNDQLRLRAETGFVSFLELSYYKPYIDQAQRTGLGFGAYYSTQKQLAFRTWNDKLQFFQSENRLRERVGFFATLTHRRGLYQNHNLVVDYVSGRVADSVVVRNENYFLESQNRLNLASIAYSYVYDKRDNRQYALKGKRFAFSAGHNGLFDKNNLTTLGTGFWHYIPLGGKFYANYSFRAKTSFPSFQPYYLRNAEGLGLGFRGDLVRGYELYVIEAQSFGLARTNLKYQVFDKVLDFSKYLKIRQFNTLPLATYINLFADAGYARNLYPALSNTKLGNKWLAGGGVGLDVVTFYNLVGRINYTFNSIGENRVFFSASRDF